MIKNVQLDLHIPPGWLHATRVGDDRDFVDKRTGEELGKLGRILRGEFKGTEDLTVRIVGAWQNGWQQGADGGWRGKMENEEKLREKQTLLWNLLQCKQLKKVRVREGGSLVVKMALREILGWLNEAIIVEEVD